MWFICELSITEINCPQIIVALLALGWYNFTLYLQTDRLRMLQKVTDSNLY